MLAIDWLNGAEVTKAVELTQDENLTIRLENIQNQAFQYPSMNHPMKFISRLSYGNFFILFFY